VQSFKYYDWIVGIFVAVLIVTQIIAQKIVSFGPLALSAGVILFPISYIFGDVLTEVYGYERTRRVIWIGFAAAILMALVFWLAVALPSAVGWENQVAFSQVLGFVPRIVVASLIAYWAGSFANSFIMAKLKVLMKGHQLWVRTIGSTIVGEAIDTVLVMLIAFTGVLPWPLLVRVGVSIYVVKVAYEVIATPLTYAVVGKLKKEEGIDLYDKRTDFTPFSTQVHEK
jgi:uncharacterized integral membrane protein (TIGR00697 family)